MNSSLFSLFLTFLNKKSDRIIGQIVPIICMDGYTPKNMLQCDGKLYNKTDFPILWSKYLIGTKPKYYAWSSSDNTVWTLSETPIVGADDPMDGPLFGNSKAGNPAYIISENSIQGQITVKKLSDESTVIYVREDSLDENDHTLPTCSTAEYEAFINTYGQCPLWTIDTGSGTFRPPLIKDGSFLQQALTGDMLGKVFNAGLPNITGSAGTQAGLDGTYHLDGAFYSDAHNVRVDSGSSSDWNYPNLAFDASRSNSIYGSSDTVQPVAIAVRYFVTI